VWPASVFQVRRRHQPADQRDRNDRLTGLWERRPVFVAINGGGFEAASRAACSPVADAVARSAGDTANQLSGSPATTGASEAAPSRFSAVSTLTALTAESGADRHLYATAAGARALSVQVWLWNGATWTVLEDWSLPTPSPGRRARPNPNSAVGVGSGAPAIPPTSRRATPPTPGPNGVIPFRDLTRAAHRYRL